MTTLQTKIIHFKIEDNLNINHIMGQRGTLFVKASISFEESDKFDSLYFGYYDMSWSSFYEDKPYVISDALRSKILAVLSDSRYAEGEAFALREDEDIVYDFSEIETRTIGDMVG